MKITKITCQKNKNKFNLFVDDNFYGGVLKEVAVANNFCIGKEIDEKALNKIILESESKEAFSKASDYLASRLHSEKELYLKLIKKGYGKQASIMAIEKLKTYGYINDLEFAKAFIQSSNKLSTNMKKSKLIQKGVDKFVIDSVLGEEDDQDLCYNMAEKYLKNKNKQECKQKLYAHLARKGFSSSSISKVLHKIYNEDFYVED